MPTAKQVEWIRKNGDVARPLILDIGSRVPETRKGSKIERFTLRDALDRNDPEVYASIVGVDMIDGQNVDVVLDLSAPESRPSALRKMRAEKGFETIYCLSVLEHVRNPWQFSRNVQRLLNPGGWLFVSVPFTFRYHGHPDDYWRMTPQAVRALFDGIEYCPDRSCVWQGADERTVSGIEATRAYANREQRTLEIVTVNCAFQKAAK